MPTLLERLREALAPIYDVDHELARGGMGSVFLARDSQLDRRVAIKVLKPDHASEVAPERFQREARILAKLKHPNIVPVFQAGEAHGISYYVMEYVEGETLAERLTRGPLSEDDGLKLADHLLSALAGAHQKQVIHRDVKPSNIFLLDDRAVLVDFGIAKPVNESGEELTATDRLIGTPAYMAPEQFLGGPVTQATDIYAAAMVLYEAFTGRRWSIWTPTDEGNWSGTPVGVRRALRRALSWLPTERWDDALTFRQALLSDEPSSFVSRKPQPPFFSFKIGLRFRHVIAVAFGYILVAWVGLEVVSMFVEAQLLPGALYEFLLVLAALGLPLSVLIAYRTAPGTPNHLDTK